MTRSNKFLSSLALAIFVFSPSLTLWAQTAAAGHQIDSEQVLIELMAITMDRARGRELEVTSEQIVELRALSEDYGKELLNLREKKEQKIAEAKKLFSDGKHVEAQEQLFKSKEPSSALAEDYLRNFSQVLLPHQLKRARQIAFQSSFKRRSKGTNEFGIFLLVAHKLDLSEDEKATLRDRIISENKEFYRQVELLQKNGRARIAEAIPAAKKEQFEEMIGDFHDVTASRRETVRHEEKK